MKYEEEYLKAYQGGRDARINPGNYFRFYKAERPHQELGYLTPAEVFTSVTVEYDRRLCTYVRIFNARPLEE